MHLLISLFLASAATLAMPMPTLTPTYPDKSVLCEPRLNANSPAPPIQAGQLIQILGRPAYEIGQFGDHNFAIVINQERGPSLPDLIEDYQPSVAIDSRFPAIPIQTSGNCLSMIVAYADHLMKGSEFRRPPDNVDLLAGDNIFQSAWQKNPYLANPLFGPTMQSLQVQLQLTLFRNRLSQLNFTITAEQTSLDFEDAVSRLQRGEKAILGAAIRIGRNRIYDVNNPRWDGVVTPGRWMPNPVEGNQLKFVSLENAIGVHALLLVQAIAIPTVGKFYVFVNTFDGRPLVAEYSTLNPALRHAVWVK